MQYYIIFIILLFCAILEQLRGKQKQLLVLFILSSFLLILFVGTRFDFGRDYYVYKDAFYTLSTENYAEYLFEPLFAILCVAIRPLGFNVFIFFIALIAILSKSRLIHKWSIYPLFSLLIYYSLSIIQYEMGQMRQAIAMIFALLAFKNCLSKDLKSFCFNVIIAIGFHYSAVVLIPCYWLSHRTISDKNILLTTLFLFPLAVINLSSLFLSFAELIGLNHFSLKIIEYAGRNESLGINPSLLMRIAVLFTFLFVNKKNGGRYKPLVLLYFYGVVLYLVFNSSPEIAMRSAVYFKILEIFIYPIMLLLFRGVFSKILVFTIICVYLFRNIINLFAEHPDAFLPYKSFIL